jgi:uncharacterized small protein (DUF1192 family)
MSNGSSLSLLELEQRIAIIRDNIWLNKPLHSPAPRMKLATRTASRNKPKSLKGWSSNAMRC